MNFGRQAPALRPRAPVGALALSLALGGCGLQATTGAAWTSHARATPTLNLVGTMQAMRESNSIVAGRLGTTFDRSVAIKNLTLHGGYDWLLVPSWLGLEGGLDLGGGQPPTRRFAGLGAYAGLQATLHARLTCGTGDHIPSFSLAFPLLELVLIPRGGLWMPPESSPRKATFLELSVEVGLRFGVGSDLVAPRQGQITDRSPSVRAVPSSPPDRCRDKPIGRGVLRGKP
jgi:hypothetical protein